MYKEDLKIYKMSYDGYNESDKHPKYILTDDLLEALGTLKRLDPKFMDAVNNIDLIESDNIVVVQSYFEEEKDRRKEDAKDEGNTQKKIISAKEKEDEENETI